MKFLISVRIFSELVPFQVFTHRFQLVLKLRYTLSYKVFWLISLNKDNWKSRDNTSVLINFAQCVWKMNCKVKFTQLYGLYSEQTEVSVRLNSEQNIFSAQHIPFFSLQGFQNWKFCMLLLQQFLWWFRRYHICEYFWWIGAFSSIYAQITTFFEIMINVELQGVVNQLNKGNWKSRDNPFVLINFT